METRPPLREKTRGEDTYLGDDAVQTLVMNEDRLQEIQERCTPLEDELGPFVKAVMVYGSAARKEHVEGSDIDILVIVDDTHPGFDREEYSAVKQTIREIQDDAPDDLDLHIQPPKPLSSWWDLLISGEPWAVTSMRDAQPVYDPSGYIRLTQKLLLEGELHGTEERAQTLIKRSREKYLKTRRLLLEDVTAELLNAMTEAAQAVLMYYGHPPPSPNHVAEELERNFVERNLLKQQAVTDYESFYELTERIDHGTLSAFSASEMDDYLQQAMAFIKAMASLFDRLETEKHEDIVSTAHEEAVLLCEEALAEEGVDLPVEEEETLQRFREVFVEQGLVSEEYWRMLQRIRDNKTAMEEGDLDGLPDEEIYASRAHLRDFESAIQNVLSREHEPDLLDTGTEAGEHDENAEDTTVDKVKGCCDRILDHYEDVVKSIWLLTVDDLQETDSVTLVILFDDVSAHDVTRDDFEETVRTAINSFTADREISINPTFYTISDYWNLVRHGSPVTFSEIREGIPVYDPSGFFLPIKKLLDAGKIPGTKEAMRSLLMKAPKRTMKVEKTYRAQILEHLYNAVVDAGQAALIVHGVSPPVQKKLADALETHLVEDGVLPARDVRRCEDVIQMWKQYEYSEMEQLTGEQLDDAMDDTIRFIESAEEVIEDADRSSSR